LQVVLLNEIKTIFVRGIYKLANFMNNFGRKVKNLKKDLYAKIRIRKKDY